MPFATEPERSETVVTRVVWEALHRRPVTATVTVLTLMVSIPALFSDHLVSLLEQRPEALWRGEWWRLFTPMLIQGFGVGQLAFNLIGIVVVGIAVEDRIGGWRWLTVYLTSGVLAIVLTSLWFPDRLDSGSSAAVGGLTGALTIGLLRLRVLPPGPSLLYGMFFAAYLSALSLAGPIAGAIVGSAGIPVFVLLRIFASVRLMRIVVVILVAVGTLVMLLLLDAHGVGLAVGMFVASMIGPRRLLEE